MYLSRDNPSRYSHALLQYMFLNYGKKVIRSLKHTLGESVS